MGLQFQKHAQNAEAFINELASHLRQPGDSERACRVLKAVLHTLRDQIPPAESMQMIAQLPLILRAIYIEGWRITGKPRKVRQYHEFIEEVMSQRRGILAGDLASKSETKDAIFIVLGMIKEKVSAGEINDLISTLPNQLKPFLEEA
jgi:uncharacterized protein (DUF2267 family)